MSIANVDKKIYRIAGVLSVIGALALTVADYLLEFSHEMRVNNSIIEPVWLSMSQWRFEWSINLCAFFIPFYITGFWMIYRALRPSNPKLALAFFLTSSYGLVMGAPSVHTILSINPIIYKYAHSVSSDVFSFAEQLIGDRIVPAVMPLFAVHYTITWIIPPILFFIAVIKGKSKYPRWTAFVNPLFITILFICGLVVLPELFVYLAPGSINKGNVLFFLMPTILLWNGDRSSSSINSPTLNV